MHKLEITSSSPFPSTTNLVSIGTTPISPSKNEITCTQRLFVTLQRGQPNEINYKELIKKQEEKKPPQPKLGLVTTTSTPSTPTLVAITHPTTTTEAVPQVLPDQTAGVLQNSLDTSQELTDSLADSQDASLDDSTMGTTKHPITTVIERIERMATEKGLGYDTEDPFIDDSEVTEIPKEVQENNYGGFFIHKGEIKKKRKSADQEGDGEEEKPKKVKKSKGEKVSKPDKEVKKKDKEKDQRSSPKDNKENKKQKKKSDDPDKKKSPEESSHHHSKTPADVEEIIKEFEKAAAQIPVASKATQKRFPKELLPLLNKIWVAVTQKIDNFPSEITKRLCEASKFQKSTLKSHLSKFKTVDARIQELQTTVKEKVELLKKHIKSADSEHSVDKAMQELIYEIISAKQEMIKIQNEKRTWEGEAGVDATDELNKEITKLGGLWQPNKKENSSLMAIFTTVKKEKKQQEKPVEKPSSPPSSNTDAEKKKVPIVERRKKKHKDTPVGGAQPTASPVPPSVPMSTTMTLPPSLSVIHSQVSPPKAVQPPPPQQRVPYSSVIPNSTLPFDMPPLVRLPNGMLIPFYGSYPAIPMNFSHTHTGTDSKAVKQ